MQEKLLSVIVPIYNKEKFLGECLESIINQTYKNLEIILVDDGSTDMSKSICCEYVERDSRIKLVHQENMGMINARYSGVKIAQGEYIIFCDADDFVERDAYQILMTIANNYCVDMVTSGCYRYYDEKHQVMDICTRSREGIYDKRQIREELIPRMLWDKNFNTWALDPSLCLKVIRRLVLLEQYKLISKYAFSFGEDSATIYPIILKINNIYVTHYCSYFHRQRTNNIPASYIVDRKFPDKLLELYYYLSSVFEKDRDSSLLLMQLDMFFAKSAQYLKQRYPYLKEEKKYQKVWMFPFQKVKVDSRIILYGAGKVGRCLRQQLRATEYCQKICWVDKNPPEDLEEVVLPQSVDFETYDYIVLAIESKDICSQIKAWIIDEGCSEEKIIVSDFEGQRIYV